MTFLKRLRSVFSYFKFLLRTRSRFAVHSPFVYDFLTNVINIPAEDDRFEKIEKLRFELLQNNQTIKVTDYGTGAANSITRKISNIAKNSIKNEKEAQLLFKLVQYFKPENILELGTSLGITSMYLALAGTGSKIYSMEGCPQTAALAREHFNTMKLDNISLIVGRIDDNLQDFIQSVDKLDFVFFDANHTYNATIRYFLQCVPYVQNQSIFVFDDIHWSAGMKKAWQAIRSHHDITLSIDLFHFGIVFFRKELSKQNFNLRF